MVFNLIALALVAGITFMHSTFGFFSGLINLFCTVVGMVVAFGFYEVGTGAVVSATGMHAAYMGPCVLVLLFFVTTLILRSIADAVVRGNVIVPQWLDTSGAIFCGFVQAQIMVGILVISVMMLPLGSSVLGFQRMVRTQQPDPDHANLPLVERQSLWTRPDEMTVSLFNWMSAGSMRGGTAFATIYPSFTDNVFYTGNTVQVESMPAATRDKVGDGFKGITVNAVAVIDGPLRDLKYRKEVPTAKRRQPNYELVSKFEPAPGNHLIRMQLTLGKASGDRVNKTGARHIFRPTMIRLVGDVGETPRDFFPQALVNADAALGTDIRLVDYDNNFSLNDQDATIEAYFEVPTDFKPRFVEYRRYARAEVRLPAAEEQVAFADIEAQKSADQIRAEQRNQLTFGQIAANSAMQDILPVESMSSSVLRRAGVQLQGERILSGRFSGPMSRFKGNDGGKVGRLEVPDGMAMVQIIYTPKEAQTLAGEVFNFVGQLNQYSAVDNRANKHPMVGYFGVVDRNGEEYVEFFYNGSGDELVDPAYASMLDFKDLSRQEVNDADSSRIGMIFLVPKGVTVVKIQNQTGEGGDLSIRTGP